MSISVTIQNIVYNLFGDGTATVFSNTLTLPTPVSIPSSVTNNDITYRVTSIAKNAFSNCTSLILITMPYGVTSIGSGAFANCSNLTSITIPDSVTSIGSGAFGNCIRLPSITIPDSVTSIGSSVFSGCTSLTSITMSNSITRISEFMCSSCRNLTSITIPNSVTSIEGFAFNSCSSLTSITIPDSVTSIGSNAFNSCSSLTSITIPDGVTIINNSTFRDCRNLYSITIPNSVTSIREYAFFNCQNLISITIPDGVTRIENSTFGNCISLTSITIPDGVTRIGDYAFRYCTSLTSITIPDSVTSIGNSAFLNCTTLFNVIVFKQSNISVDTNSFTNVSNNPDSLITFYGIIDKDGLVGNWQTISTYYRNQIYLNPTPPTPTLGPLNTYSPQTYGNSPYSLTNPTSDSQGSFSYTSSDTSVATIFENIVNIVGAGTTIITATQAETDNYSSASTSSPLEVYDSTPENPAIIDSGPGLLYFMNTSSSYVKITNNLEINGDLIAKNYKVITSNNNINITKNTNN